MVFCGAKPFTESLKNIKLCPTGWKRTFFKFRDGKDSFHSSQNTGPSVMNEPAKTQTDTATSAVKNESACPPEFPLSQELQDAWAQMLAAKERESIEKDLSTITSTLGHNRGIHCAGLSRAAVERLATGEPVVANDYLHACAQIQSKMYMYGNDPIKFSYKAGDLSDDFQIATKEMITKDADKSLAETLEQRMKAEGHGAMAYVVRPNHIFPIVNINGHVFMIETGMNGEVRELHNVYAGFSANPRQNRAEVRNVDVWFSKQKVRSDATVSPAQAKLHQLQATKRDAKAFSSLLQSMSDDDPLLRNTSLINHLFLYPDSLKALLERFGPTQTEGLLRDNVNFQRACAGYPQSMPIVFDAVPQQYHRELSQSLMPFAKQDYEHLEELLKYMKDEQLQHDGYLTKEWLQALLKDPKSAAVVGKRLEKAPHLVEQLFSTDKSLPFQVKPDALKALCAPLNLEKRLQMLSPYAENGIHPIHLEAVLDVIPEASLEQRLKLLGQGGITGYLKKPELIDKIFSASDSGNWLKSKEGLRLVESALSYPESLEVILKHMSPEAFPNLLESIKAQKDNPAFITHLIQSGSFARLLDYAAQHTIDPESLLTMPLPDSIVSTGKTLLSYFNMKDCNTCLKHLKVLCHQNPNLKGNLEKACADDRSLQFFLSKV